jgi:uncharacterized damage-inducible protein DinB
MFRETNSNPKVEEIRRSVQISYDELNRLLAERLETLDPAKLYQRPADNEWTIMESLAHIVEFMPYWADEIEKLVAVPGQNFGRTLQDIRRLRAISEHGSDDLERIRAALPGSYARLEQVLGELKDSDLELTGHHSRFGGQALAWFIEDFVTHHLTSHLEQLNHCLEMISNNAGATN